MTYYPLCDNTVSKTRKLHLL